MNSVSLIGRLGRDPELRYTQSGTAVCTLSIAVDEGGGENKRTHWFDAVVWKEQAESAAQHLAKGARVGISGRLQQRTWETQDGQKRRVVEIVASYVDYLDRKPGGRARDPGEDEDGGVVPF